MMAEKPLSHKKLVRDKTFNALFMRVLQNNYEILSHTDIYWTELNFLKKKTKKNINNNGQFSEAKTNMTIQPIFLDENKTAQLSSKLL